MASWLKRKLSSCWRPVQRQYARMRVSVDENDLFMSYRDLVHHACGDISMAVVQANYPVEDTSQVEVDDAGAFIGIYDGHGGPEAAQYVCDNLYPNLKRFASDNGAMPEDAIRRAFHATEEGFVNHARQNPGLVTVGCCCLVGVIRGHVLYIGNLGDSRAVLGSVSTVTGDIMASQLTTDDNANSEEVRRELQANHPDDAEIVQIKNGSWRVKGIIQVTKAIGDLYLKSSEVNAQDLLSKFRLSQPLRRPVLSADPTIKAWNFEEHDKFCIFASDGLWEHLSNEGACEIVHSYPRQGVARKLITEALKEATKKAHRKLADLIRMDNTYRRYFHDDITVIVVFIDHGRHQRAPGVSVRGG